MAFGESCPRWCSQWFGGQLTSCLALWSCCPSLFPARYVTQSGEHSGSSSVSSELRVLPAHLHSARRWETPLPPVPRLDAQCSEPGLPSGASQDSSSVHTKAQRLDCEVFLASAGCPETWWAQGLDPAVKVQVRLRQPLPCTAPAPTWTLDWEPPSLRGLRAMS